MIKVFLRVGLGVMVLTVVSGFFANPAQASTISSASNYRLKDSAIIERDGVWHVFSIHDCSPLVPSCTTPSQGFRHYSSVDMFTWTDHGFVLPPTGTGAEATEVWAPSIVERDGTYYMFYTGVARNAQNVLVQSIVFATSTDLMSWTRPISNVALNCDTISWAYWNTSDPYDGAACRDPHIHWNASSSVWVMTYSTRLPDDGTTAPWFVHPMVIAMAVSTNLTDWTDAGYMNTTRWHVAESPVMIEKNNQVYVIWTDNCARGACLQYATAPTIAGPFTRVGPISTDQPMAYAAEFFSRGVNDYSLSVLGFTLKIQSVTWPGNVPTQAPLAVTMLRGSAWLDDNHDQVFDGSEVQVAGLPMALYRDTGDDVFSPDTDQRYAAATSDSAGAVTFSSVLPGTYWAMSDFTQVIPGQVNSIVPQELVHGPFVVTGAGMQNFSLPAYAAGSVWPTAPLTASNLYAQAEPALPFTDLREIFVGQLGSGQVLLTLSNSDTNTWWYWNDGWQLGDGTSTTANTPEVVNEHLADFPVGVGQLRWRVFSTTIDQDIQYVSVRLDHRSDPPSGLAVPPSNPVTLRPTRTFTLHDLDGNALAVQIEIDRLPDFTSPDRFRASTLSSCAGWLFSCPLTSSGMTGFQPPVNLQNDQTYWRARTIDLNGSGEWSDWSAPVIVPMPPVLVASEPSLTIRSTTSVEISWTTNVPSNSGYEYFSDEDENSYFDPSLSVDHHYTITNLIPGGTYDFVVMSVDAVGQWTRREVLDVTLPSVELSISEVQVTVSHDTAILRWTTNVPASGRVDYGVNGVYNQTQAHTDLQTIHQITLTQLTPGQRYQYRISSTAVMVVQTPEATFTAEQIFYELPEPEDPLPILRTPIRRGGRR